MRERPNRHAWKACDLHGSVGSNPTASASLFRAILRDGPIRARTLQHSHPILSFRTAKIGQIASELTASVTRLQFGVRPTGRPPGHFLDSGSKCPTQSA